MSVLNQILERFNRIPADIKNLPKSKVHLLSSAFCTKRGAKAEGSLMPKEKKEQAKSFT